jgi:hypothetical protein
MWIVPIRKADDPLDAAPISVNQNLDDLLRKLDSKTQ